MPPWAAVPGYGEFVNSNDLTLRETQFVVSWVEGLGPRNAGTVFRNIVALDAEPGPLFAAKSPVAGWPSGEPDLTRPLSANTIEPGQPDRVERWWSISADRRASGSRRGLPAGRPPCGARGLVLGGGDRPMARELDTMARRLGASPGGGLPVASWFARRGRALLSQWGRVGDRQGRPRPVLRRRIVAKEPTDVVLKTPGVAAARAGSHRFRAETRLTADTAALAVWPELRPGMTSIEVSARRPDGSTEILLFAVDPILDWPTPYVFKEPIRLPRDTELSVTTYYAVTPPLMVGQGASG